MKTSQDLFKQLDEAEALFSKGSIKIAQKKVREVISKSKELDKVPNKLRHKLNFAIGQSRYFDDVSSFATNPKREELIKEISTIIESPLDSLKNWTKCQTNSGINLILQLVNQDILMICRLLQLIQKEKN